MVDTSLHQTNRAYLSDIIEFTPSPSRIHSVEIARKYRETNWSTQQLADHFEVSKQVILKHLSAAKIRRDKKRGRSPDNYRLNNPPYGYRVQDGRLVVNPKEMRVLRLIVELRERRGLSYSKVAAALNEKGLVTRNQKVWSTLLVTHFHKKWKGKL